MTQFEHRFFDEIAASGLPAEPDVAERIGDAELEALPVLVRRYLGYMTVPGRRRDWSFRTAWTGRFRRRRNQPWLRCEAWQYNSGLAVARIMHLQVRFARILPVTGRDTYIDGKGRMLIKLLDRVVVGDGRGEEFDLGELVTYLNDGLLLAPTMLLGPHVSWSAVDEESFDVTLTDHGRSVSGRLYVDRNGAPRDFSTTDRFLEDPARPGRWIRSEWRTPIEEWTRVEGRPLPARAGALWRLPEGDFPYVDFRLRPESVAFNVSPGR